MTWSGRAAAPHHKRRKTVARKRALSKEQEMELFHMVQKSFSNEEIAKKFGISKQTVGTYYRRVLRERGRELEKGKPRAVVTYSDERFLTFDVDGGYVGHTTVGGIEETNMFKATDDADATAKFDKWLSDMDDEAAFLAMVEREPVDVTPAPVPEIDVRPWKDVAAEAQGKVAQLEEDVLNKDLRIAELEERVAALKASRALGFADTDDRCYVVMVTKPSLRGYGAYTTMEAALAEVDRLNETGALLGIDDAFSVHELSWKE